MTEQKQMEPAGGQDELDSDFRAEVRRTRKHFSAPRPGESIFAELEATFGSVRAEYRAPIESFFHNLTAALSTVRMPFLMASTSTQHSFFERFLISERIRLLPIPPMEEPEHPVPPDPLEEAAREKEAHIKAGKAMEEFVHSDDGWRAISRQTCQLLLVMLDGGMDDAAQELLHQGLVLLWSAFEVLYRDTFEVLLNADPTKITTLMANPTTRKRFGAERLPLDKLIEHGFNLSARLGTVLVGEQDMSDLISIKAVYGVLFPNNRILCDALAHRDLWTLYQRRHLVVHRRGIVDQNYLDATGETHAVATRLVVTPRDFENALKVVVAAGTALALSLAAGGQA